MLEVGLEKDVMKPGFKAAIRRKMKKMGVKEELGLRKSGVKEEQGLRKRGVKEEQGLRKRGVKEE
jgi:hypothetical protein